MTRRIEVLGGGPAGLYAARLLKLKNPELEVVVYERMRGEAEIVVAGEADDRAAVHGHMRGARGVGGAAAAAQPA